MGQARLTRGGSAVATLLVVTAAVLCPEGSAAAAPSRFASYDTEADCVGAGTFQAAICHTAFANARSEYESKTPSFPTAALCGRRFPACMAWPPGSNPKIATYRPAWDGVDIVDTPKERSVTPAPGSTGRTIRFASRPLDAEPRALDIRGAARGSPGLGAAPAGRRPGSASTVVRAGAEPALPPGAVPPPGSGFKLEDGVLTFPAPARFQPKNLPKSPD